MSIFENKLVEIEKKLVALVKIKNDYQQQYLALEEENELLKKENEALKHNLSTQSDKINEIQTESNQLKIAYQNDNEEIKKKIDKYIQDIDSGIEWLKSL